MSLWVVRWLVMQALIDPGDLVVTTAPAWPNLPAVPLILSGLILLMTVMTNVVSNNAAAVIGTPVAISIAQQLNAPVEHVNALERPGRFPVQAGFDERGSGLAEGRDHGLFGNTHLEQARDPDESQGKDGNCPQDQGVPSPVR